MDHASTSISVEYGLMKKLYLYIILAVAILGTAGYFLLWNSGSKDVRYRTEKVGRGTIIVQVRATGTVNPVQTVEVGSQVSGRIEKIYVDFNSKVRKGQIIAQIDSTFLYATVKQSEASLERAKAQVNNTQRTLKRTQDLFNKNLVSQADLDAAKTANESAVADLKAAEADLDRQVVNLRYAAIRAPIDGVVISRDVDVGQTVAASLQTPKLFSIGNDLTLMQVEASVDEADIGQVKLGQEVAFTVDAYPDEQFKGKVSQVRLSPVLVQNVVTYTVIIDVPNPDLKLRPGMTATVSILVDKRDDAIRVPNLALRFQPSQEVLDRAEADQPKDSSRSDSSQARRGQGTRQWQGGSGARAGAGRQGHGSDNTGGSDAGQRKMSHVWILLENKTLAMRTLMSGINDSRYTEVLRGGLKEGDEVVIGMVANDATASNNQTNPFGPRPMMGGGRGR